MAFTMALIAIAACVALTLGVVGICTASASHRQPTDVRDWRGLRAGRRAAKRGGDDPAAGRCRGASQPARPLDCRWRLPGVD
jgi:hypothetical protein